MTVPLSSPAGRRTFDRLRRGCLVALDFDGTLVPVVARAEDARMGPQMTKLLREIGRLTPLAIVSGRGRRDLRRRLGFKPRYLISNHGLEGLGREREALQAKRLTKAWLKQLRPGRHIENKIYSLSLHYRLAADRAAARNRLRREISRLQPPPRVIGGKCVFNLMPEGGLDKGSALKLILARLSPRQGLFIGDDDTDEEVFKLKDRRLMTIRVGRGKGSKAQFYINRQTEVFDLLKNLLEHLKHAPDEAEPNRRAKGRAR
jgi:trehalose 6-phosphate phosphatase